MKTREMPIKASNVSVILNQNNLSIFLEIDDYVTTLYKIFIKCRSYISSNLQDVY